MKRPVLAVIIPLLVLGINIFPAALITAQGRPATPVQAVPGNSTTELNNRLQERKTKQATRLNAAESARLAGRCQAAQQKIDALTKKFSNTEQPLKYKYDAQLTRLQSIQQKLKDRGADTARLEIQISEYGQKYQALIAAINTFNLSLSDLKAVDCKADPAAFKATLQSARQEAKAIQDSRASFNSSVKGPLQDALKETKKSLPAIKEQ